MDMRDLKTYSRFSLKHLQAMHRIAKDRHRGLRPFFADPKAMIALRTAIDIRVKRVDEETAAVLKRIKK